jgi:hypothetical protein
MYLDNHHEQLVDHQIKQRKRMHMVQEEIEKLIENELYHRTSYEPKKRKKIYVNDEFDQRKKRRSEFFSLSDVFTRNICRFFSK